MERRSLFNGLRKRNVPASSCAQSEPNAWADVQSTSTRECSSARLPSPVERESGASGLISHLSNHTLSPSARSRSANGRFVLGAVAEEHVERELATDGDPAFRGLSRPATRFSSLAV